MVFRILVSLFLVAGIAAPSESADQLRWKLSTGDSLNYAVQNEMIMTATVGGFDTKSRINQTMHMGWDVKTLAAGGNYVLSQVIERIRVEMEANGQDSVVYDSGKEEIPDDAMVRSLANVFSRIVNREFVITMAPTGSITDVKIPEDMLETLKAAAAGTPTDLDEKTLKQMLSQTSVILPSKPVATGDEWNSRQTVELGFATLRMEATMTYKGIDPDGLAIIEYTPKVTLQPKKNAPVQITLKNSQGAGKVLFDKDRGRIVRMQLNLRMEMQTGIQGQKVSQKINQQTVMVLQD